jgi:hypothetical protein
MPNILGSLPSLDNTDDTLKKLLASYQAPTVLSSGQAALNAALQPTDASTSSPSVLGKITSPGTGVAPSSDSIAYALPRIPSPNATPSEQGLVDSQNSLQDAQIHRSSLDKPKYDFSQHGVLGNIGHVLGRIGNIGGDILDPEATSLIPNSDLFNAHQKAGADAEVQKQTENSAHSRSQQALSH